MNIVLALFLSACSTPSEPRAPSGAPATPPPSAASTHEEHEPANGEHEAEHDAHEGAAPAAAPVPHTYGGIIAELQTRKSNLATLLAAGKLEEVHPQAQVVMDLAVALPGKASAESKATVSLKALDLKEKADALHDHADAGDAAGAQAAFDAVSADIDALAAASK
jgi:hypothetical protein